MEARGQKFSPFIASKCFHPLLWFKTPLLVSTQFALISVLLQLSSAHVQRFGWDEGTSSLF